MTAPAEQDAELATEPVAPLGKRKLIAQGNAAAPAVRTLRTMLFRLGADLVTRSGRLRPSRVFLAPRLLVIVAWAITAVLCLLLLLPGVLTRESASGDGLSMPRWLMGIILLACGVFAALVLAARMLDRHPRGRDGRVVAMVTLVGCVGAATLPLAWLVWLGDSIATAVGAAGAVTALVISVIVLASDMTEPRQAALIAIAAAGVGTPWAAVAWRTAFTATDQLLWMSLTAIGFAVTYIAAFYGLAMAAESRSAKVTATLRARRGPLLVGIAIVLVAGIYASRLTWARTMFGEQDALLWSLRDFGSWPHAALVAALIGWFVVRSERRPLSARGWRSVVVSVTVLATLTYVLLGVTSAGVLIAGSVGLSFPVSLEAVDFTNAAGVAGIALLLFFVVTPAYRRSIGRAVAIVAIVYLIPGATSQYIVALWNDVIAFWASPVQIVVALLIVVTVLLIVKLAGRLGAVSWSALLRLVIVPVVGIHAVVVIPTIIGTGFVPLVIVLGVAAGFLLFMPRVAASRWRHSAVVVGASATALFVVGGTALALSNAPMTEQAVTVASLWLVIPVIAALTIRQEPVNARPQSVDADAVR